MKGISTICECRSTVAAYFASEASGRLKAAVSPAAKAKKPIRRREPNSSAA